MIPKLQLHLIQIGQGIFNLLQRTNRLKIRKVKKKSSNLPISLMLKVLLCTM